MNVSLLAMILWLLNCYLWIKGLFKKSPTKLDPSDIKIENEKLSQEAVLRSISILAGAIGFASIFFNVWYYWVSSATIQNVFFTLISAILIIANISSIGKVISLCNKLAQNEIIYAPKNKLSIFTLMKMLHLVYFGFYTFTGISLFEILIKQKLY